LVASFITVVSGFAGCLLIYDYLTFWVWKRCREWPRFLVKFTAVNQHVTGMLKINFAFPVSCANVG
jgi:hypothetical protein